MRDVLFLALTVGFFALSAAYVRACAALAGDGEPAAGLPLDDGDELESEVAA